MTWPRGPVLAQDPVFEKLWRSRQCQFLLMGVLGNCLQTSEARQLMAGPVVIEILFEAEHLSEFCGAQWCEWAACRTLPQ